MSKDLDKMIREVLEEMAMALEHYESCHYDLQGNPCNHDSTASEVLEKYYKLLDDLK